MHAVMGTLVRRSLPYVNRKIETEMSHGWRFMLVKEAEISWGDYIALQDYLVNI